VLDVTGGLGPLEHLACQCIVDILTGVIIVELVGYRIDVLAGSAPFVVGSAELVVNSGAGREKVEWNEEI
jgi:hypothetical protein